MFTPRDHILFLLQNFPLRSNNLQQCTLKVSCEIILTLVKSHRLRKWGVNSCDHVPLIRTKFHIRYFRLNYRRNVIERKRKKRKKKNPYGADNNVYLGIQMKSFVAEEILNTYWEFLFEKTYEYYLFLCSKQSSQGKKSFYCMF